MATQLGRYQLQRPIGRGGMAEVWLGSRRGAGGIAKRVVIKRILRERVKDPRFLDLFVREAEISMSLSHKNIVPIFDFGRAGDELFLVMDYVDGPNLALALSAANKLDQQPGPVLISHIVFEACQALAYAHDYKDAQGNAQRIAHRDVTPSNFLLSFSGEVKLGDFGLAAATADLSEGDGRTRGTPGYMAPEQASGEMVGPGADLYSLGLILYEVLLGERARKGEQADQVQAASRALPMLPDSIPGALREVCSRACQLDVNERYASAQEMAADIDAYLVQARAEAQSDRRPMPQQLTDWLADLFPKGLVTKDLQGTEVQGSARTYLDDGVQDLLEDPGNNTMRSMAVTVVEGAPADLEDTDDAPDRLRSEPQELPKRDLAPLMAIAALVGALGLGGYWMTRDDRVAPASMLSPDAALVIIDATPDAAPSPDAAPIVVDASNPPALDASPGPTGLQVRTTRPNAGTTGVGLLRVSTSPWATVVVTGRSEGCDETPCSLQLPFGTYQILLENPIAGLKKRVTVVIDGDNSLHQVLQPESQ